jgi:AAHS family 4-hydroxybenzoate transporter-like MFS transporter
VAIFLLGAAVTLAIAGVSLFALPESPLFLLRKAGNQAQLRALLARLGAPVPHGPARYAIQNEPPARSSVPALFAPDRRLATILFWILNGANMAAAYYLFTWLPSIVVAKGATAQIGILSISAFNAGGIVGGLLMAPLLERFGPTVVLGGGYVTAIATALALSTFHVFDAPFMTVLALCGGAVAGSQFCLNAVVNQFYPSAMRATASGYATGVGRLAGAAAPTVGAVIMASPALSSYALAAAAGPTFVAFVAVLMLHFATAHPLGSKRGEPV